MKELDQRETAELITAICKVKKYIASPNLELVTKSIVQHNLNAAPLAPKVLEQIEKNDGQPPQAFNDGLNDGPIAGQTVPHFHWHTLPRWQGEVADPRGGIRHILERKVD